MKRIIVYTSLAGLTIILTYLVVDYFDVLSNLGLHAETINISLFASLIGSLVAVCLFVITYFSVNRWNAKRDENQRESAALLLKKTYEYCLSHLEVFDNGLNEIIIKKTDFNKEYYKDSPVTRFTEMSFLFDDLILRYANEGVISKKQLDNYLTVKNKFEAYIYSHVIFFDDMSKAPMSNRELVDIINKAMIEV